MYNAPTSAEVRIMLMGVFCYANWSISCGGTNETIQQAKVELKEGSPNTQKQTT
jgi:hypothetical protein